MRVARVCGGIGVIMFAVVIWQGGRIVLGYAHSGPGVVVAFYVSLFLMSNSCSYAGGWTARQGHDLDQSRRDRRATAPRDASLTGVVGSDTETLILPRVDPHPACYVQGTGRIVCTVPDCLHQPRPPRAAGWTRTFAGGWLCPCDARHAELISEANR